MKIIATVTILLATIAVASAQQRPQTYTNQQVQPQQQANPPSDLWCREMALNEGSIQVCSAYTEAQCMASRNPGDATCYPNPRYDPRFRR